MKGILSVNYRNLALIPTTGGRMRPARAAHNRLLVIDVAYRTKYEYCQDKTAALIRYQTVTILINLSGTTLHNSVID